MESAARRDFDNDNDPVTPEIPVLDGNGNPIDNRCTDCHTSVHRSGGRGDELPPAGQLELTDGLSTDEPDHLHAYRELLVTDNLQYVDAAGVLTDATEIVQDADGNDILDIPAAATGISCGR